MVPTTRSQSHFPDMSDPQDSQSGSQGTTGNEGSGTPLAVPSMEDAMRTMMVAITRLTEAQGASIARERTPVAEVRRSAGRIEKPAPFYGDKKEDQSDLATFLSQCDNVFRMDPYTYDNDDFKIGYAISLLRGYAGKVVTQLNRDKNQADVLHDYELFKDFMTRTFGKTDEKREAQRELAALTQTGTASAYFAEVMRLASILGWTTDMHQEVLVPTVFKGLKEETRWEVNRFSKVFTTVTEMRDFVVPLDNNLHQINLEKKQKGREEEPRFGRRGVSSSNVGFDRRAQTPAPNAGGSGGFGGRPVGTRPSLPLRYINGTYRVLTKDEYLARRTGGVCWQCGEKGHRMDDCPHKAPEGTPAVTVKTELRQGKA